MSAVFLFAYLEPDGEFFLSTNPGYEMAKESKNPPVSFPIGQNIIVIGTGARNPEPFRFTGFNMVGVKAESTPDQRVFDPQAVAALPFFDVHVKATAITVLDINLPTHAENLNFEYTIYCQRISDGVAFEDDPRIINQTGGGG